MAEDRSSVLGGARALPKNARRSVLGETQTLSRLIQEVAARLASFDDPRREATELVAALLDVPRHWPLLRGNKWMPNEEWARALAAAEARAMGAPLAYAVGRASFRKLTLAVDQRVLIPRPETELLVELVLARVAPGGTAIDVGTGSGAIAIALATEGRFDRVIATDISADALAVARANAALLAPSVEFLPGTLPRTARARAIVSNPPYIAYDEIGALPPSVRDWEPMIALLSAGNGLATTARIVRDAATRLESGGLLALEVDARRAALVAELVAADERYEEIGVHLDLAGRERFVLATKHGGRRTARRGGERR